MDLLPAKKSQAIETGGTPRVNLLPLAVIERRAQQRVLRDWLIRIAGAMVLVAVVCLGIFGWQMVTLANQAAVTRIGDDLLTQIAAKSEIQQLLNDDAEIVAYRDEALATQLDWSDALASIKSALPDGATICAYELTAGGAPAADPLTATGLSGTVQICGAFASASPFLNAIAELEGVLEVRAVNAQQDTEGGVFTHTIAVVLDQFVYLSVREAETADAESATAADGEETTS